MNIWQGTAGDELSQMLKAMDSMSKSKLKRSTRPKGWENVKEVTDVEEGKDYVMKSPEKKDEMPP